MSRPDLDAIRARLEGANEEWRRAGRPVKADFGIAGALGLKQRIYNIYLDSAAAVVLADHAPTDLAALLEYVGELEARPDYLERQRCPECEGLEIGTQRTDDGPLIAFCNDNHEWVK